MRVRLALLALCSFSLLPAQTAHSTVLTNEAGLIDNLIAQGHGSHSLYQVLQALQPDSYGFIHTSFLSQIAATPPSSQARTVPLSTFAGITGGVAVNSDGTVFQTATFGRDAVGYTGWSRHNGGPGTFGLGDVWFGNAQTEADHVVLQPGYHLFAIVWAVPDVTMDGVLLSNEGGALLDRFVAAGWGARSLYEILQHLQPISNGAISPAYLAQLAASPHTRDAFAYGVSGFADPANNPILISPDGQGDVAPIYGANFRTRPGFQTLTARSSVVGDVVFTVATAPENYIYAGATLIVEPGRSGHFSYRTTAIVYADAAPPPATPIPPTAVLVVAGAAAAALYRWRSAFGARP